MRASVVTSPVRGLTCILPSRGKGSPDMFLTFMSENAVGCGDIDNIHGVRILVVEDERKLAQVLASALQAQHYDVVVAPTGEAGFFRANAETFDLVVLDLMLPGRGGLEILETLRKRHVQTPVLILTAPDGIEDRGLRLDLRADDYLVKPFALPQLLPPIPAPVRPGPPPPHPPPKPAHPG